MNQLLLRLTLIGLAFSVGGTAFAQTDLPYIFTARPKNTFSAALKIKSSGANVTFGNLGTVQTQPVELTVNSAGIVVPTGNYVFHDGQLRADAKSARGEESDTAVTAGATVYTQGGARYNSYVPVADSAGKKFGEEGYVPTFSQVADSLSYKEGQTRYWNYQDNSQISDGYVNMHSYSAVSNGAKRDAASGASGGFELSLNRELGAIGKKGSSWGASIAFGVTDINAKSSGLVTSNLVTTTGRFSLFGQTAPGAPYQAPSYADLPLFNADGTPVTKLVTNSDGTTSTTQVIVSGGKETTTPIAQTSTLTQTNTPGGVQVDGRWQLKGAYYMMRMGPSFRYQVSPRISISASAGLATAYVGSVYSTQETLVFPNGVPILETTSGITSAPVVAGELRKREFMLGYYGELNLEYWITFRTGFFVGLVYERIGSYQQELGSRTASVNIGSGAAFRIGVVTRF